MTSLSREDLVADESRVPELTPEQRVLQKLIDYQQEYKDQTADYAPGNRYWGDKFMTIIGEAKKILNAHTVETCIDNTKKKVLSDHETNTPEDEPCPTCGQSEGAKYQGQPHDHVCPDCGREMPVTAEDDRYQIAREVIESAVEAISKQKSFQWHKDNVYATEVLDWLGQQQAEEEE